jgi:hypothetical protein
MKTVSCASVSRGSEALASTENSQRNLEAGVLSRLFWRIQAFTGFACRFGCCRVRANALRRIDRALFCGYVGHSRGASTGVSRLSRRSRKTLPQSPAPTEAARVPIFDMSSSVPSPNARVAMKSDIVNPIPQSQLAPKIFSQDTLAGGVASPRRVDNRAKSHIPAGFPRNKPRATPRLTGCLAAAEVFPRMRTPALANANRGMTRKLTQG